MILERLLFDVPSSPVDPDLLSLCMTIDTGLKDCGTAEDVLDFLSELYSLPHFVVYLPEFVMVFDKEQPGGLKLSILNPAYILSPRHKVMEESGVTPSAPTSSWQLVSKGEKPSVGNFGDLLSYIVEQNEQFNISVVGPKILYLCLVPSLASFSPVALVGPDDEEALSVEFIVSS